MTKEKLIEQLSRTPFIPHPAMRNPHAQTIMALLIPRRFKRVNEHSEPRLFDTAPGVKVLAHCSWQQNREQKPTLVIAHGMEGSTQSRYMLGTAEKALGAGFNVLRVNFRNCGGTEHLTPTLYHAGLTDDLRYIISELVERDHLQEIYLAGFSLGGNVVLKLAGEYGEAIPEALRGVVAVSPSIDLALCADAIELRSNILYHMHFTLSLRRRLMRKARLFPNHYDRKRLRGVWTIRKFDDAITSRHAGFRDVADYYERASALPYIKRITIPTLIIHAKDDPFIPFAQLEREEITTNPNVTVIATDHGGHVGFISGNAEGENRFWAEAKIVDFVSLLSQQQD
ncbi:MAG TPA: alpha/beta fold hydrolase [Blastocatellia bacterium]|nr:alpha/beta fold hydrolase [Blastocatellia bacterium]